MENITGYVIGFGGKFWILWNVSIEKTEYGTETHNTYIQNLSLDLELRWYFLNNQEINPRMKIIK